MKERCQLHKHFALKQYATIFVFLTKKMFFNISISGGRSGEREVSTVTTRYPEQYATTFVFQSKIFASILNFWRSFR